MDIGFRNPTFLCPKNKFRKPTIHKGNGSEGQREDK